MQVRITRPFVESWATFNPGQELAVDPARGLSLIQQGLAERIDNAPETAAMPDRGEKAVRFRTAR